MRRSSLLVAGLVVAAGVSTALAQADQGHTHPQTQPPMAAAPAPKASAKIIFDRARHDFGKVLDQTTVTATFKFTNTGTETLVLGEPQGSCSCTAGKLEKKAYAPGESGEINVEFDPRNRRGAQNRSVTIPTNDPNASRFMLTVDAFVTPLVEIEPNFVRFGQVQRGTAQTILVDVTGRAPGFTLTHATVRGEHIAAEVFPAEDLMIDRDQVRRAGLMVSLSDKAPLGNMSVNITLYMNDSNGVEMQRNLSVLAEIVGEVQVLPNRLNLGLMEKAGSWERQIRVTNRDGKTFKILGVQERTLEQADGQRAPAQLADVQYVATPVTEGDYTSYLVTIKGALPEQAVAVTTDIVILTDVVEEKEVPVRLIGRVRQPAPTAGRPAPAPGVVAPGPQGPQQGPATGPVAPRGEQRNPD